MFAIIETGGKQYRVKKNDFLRVEKLEAEQESSLSLSNVLLIQKEDNTVVVGAPYIKNAKVEATVVNQIRDKKVIVFKKKRRHNYRRKQGHRQYLTVLKINKVFVS